MVVLVTGAAGFLGAAICEELAAAGHEVVGVGRPDCEIPSPEFARRLDGAAPELVVHCAGPASVGASVEEPAADFAGSAGVLSGVLDMLRRLGSPPRLLLVSSAAVYGNPVALPVGEQAAVAPVSPYGYHRAASEALAAEFHEIYGLQFAVMRVFSAYGEGLDRQLLWDATRKGVTSGRIELHGTGRESRDFIHVTDVAAAATQIAERSPFAADVYNVGSGEETTVAEIAELIRAELGLAEDAVSFKGDPRAGDPTNWRADVARLKSLGFSTRTEIGVGVPAYASWARDRLASSAKV